MEKSSIEQQIQRLARSVSYRLNVGKKSSFPSDGSEANQSDGSEANQSDGEASSANEEDDGKQSHVTEGSDPAHSFCYMLKKNNVLSRSERKNLCKEMKEKLGDSEINSEKVSQLLLAQVCLLIEGERKEGSGILGRTKRSASAIPWETLKNTAVFFYSPMNKKKMSGVFEKKVLDQAQQFMNVKNRGNRYRALNPYVKKLEQLSLVDTNAPALAGNLKQPDDSEKVQRVEERSTEEQRKYRAEKFDDWQKNK
jgi:hypothetical protein